MMTTTQRLLCFALCLSASLAGCNLSQPYPAKQLYVLDAGTPETTGPSVPNAVLRVARARVAEPFSKVTLYTQVEPGRFEADYYANFAAEPDRLITSELIDWLSATGQYAAVVERSSTADAPRLLQCTVSEFYGDKTDSSGPRAVVAARFILLDESDVAARVVFSNAYRASEPLRGSGPDALAGAMGRALGDIFTQVAADLRLAR